MTEEEKKLFLFTQMMTKLNAKYDDKIQYYANECNTPIT